MVVHNKQILNKKEKELFSQLSIVSAFLVVTFQLS